MGDEELAHAAGGRAGLEIYDVIWNLCDLANILRIDLGEAFAAKIAINQARQW